MSENGQESRTAVSAAIVDYGLGNLFSVSRACGHAGMSPVITSSADDILAADIVFLPGVGAFGDAMDALRRADLVKPLLDYAQSGKPLVGICLGLQLLMSESREFGVHDGLGLIEGPVVRFDNPREGDRALKVPQVGWNRISPPAGGPDWSGTLLDTTGNGEYMYFVHSYHACPASPSTILAISRYGDREFCSAVRSDNVYAFQFHPEKSGPAGLEIYRSAAKLAAGLIEQSSKRNITIESCQQLSAD